jgi:hypothetical protein
MWTGSSNPLANPDAPRDPAYDRWLRAIYGGAAHRPSTEEEWAEIDPFARGYVHRPIRATLAELDAAEVFPQPLAWTLRHR